MRTRLEQPLRFVLVGAGGFLLNLAAFTGLYGLGAPYTGASVLAYLLANAAMYAGNRQLTFRRADVDLLAGYLRFLVVGLLIAVLTLLAVAVLVETLRLDPRPAQALALAALVPPSFVLSKRFAFRLRPELS